VYSSGCSIVMEDTHHYLILGHLRLCKLPVKAVRPPWHGCAMVGLAVASE
jgi:hypothetical protein